MRRPAPYCVRCRDPAGLWSAEPHTRGCRTVRRRLATALTAAAALAVVLVVEDGREKAVWEHRNRDPRVGPVLLVPDGTQWKVCDGTTLVYHSDVYGGQQLSPDHDNPECTP